jgi:hypothetical protein
MTGNRMSVASDLDVSGASSEPRVTFDAEREIAFDSPDHVIPWERDTRALLTSDLAKNCGDSIRQPRPATSWTSDAQVADSTQDSGVSRCRP